MTLDALTSHPPAFDPPRPNQTKEHSQGSLRGPARRRVVILGGGLSGLAAAYELTRTEELRHRFEITVYQMGFRLGGKLASGRNAAHSHRNEEHGLHVWFGYYENAFRLAREVYERWESPEGCPWKSPFDVFEPQRLALMGRPEGKTFGAWQALHGCGAGLPGDGATPPGGLEALALAVDAICAQTLALAADLGVRLPRWASAPRPSDPGEAAGDKSPLRMSLDEALSRVSRLLGDWGSSKMGLSLENAQRIDAILLALQVHVLPWVRRLVGDNDALREHVFFPLDLFIGMLRGLLGPRFGVYQDGNLDRLNHLELREWLAEAGVRSETLELARHLHVPYDAFFQHDAGDPRKRVFEAGTAVRICLRTFFLHRGASFYLLNGGMGEAFIAPLYEVLRARGVRFEFFHRIEDLSLSRDGRRVARIHMKRQAETIGRSYEPTFVHEGLVCWPSEPDWAQLRHGELLRARGVDFESRFSPRDHERPVTLEDGVHFDDVILALPLGALTERGGEPSPIRALSEKNPRLRRALEGLNLVPSIAAQLWLTRSPNGFLAPRPSMVSWAHPLTIFSDMTPVLAHESWDSQSRPSATLYLCGTYPSDVPSTPSTTEDAKRRAVDIAREQIRIQLERHAPALFPEARTPEGHFDWNWLHDPSGASGARRLEAQYIRVNVEPSDLCDGAAPSTSTLRLEAHESGVENLALSSTWIRTGINSTCVEAAVMSGMLAAHAVAGVGREIFGDRFLAAKGTPGILPPGRAPCQERWTTERIEAPR